jgi:hypothetical protein
VGDVLRSELDEVGTVRWYLSVGVHNLIN